MDDYDDSSGKKEWKKDFNMLFWFMMALVQNCRIMRLVYMLSLLFCLVYKLKSSSSLFNISKD